MKFPRDLRVCGSCGHYQIGYIIPAETIYDKREEVTEESDRQRIADYIKKLKEEFSGTVLLVGANNGVFFEELFRVGLTVYTVNPLMRNNGMPQWFNSKTAAQIAETLGRFDLILSNGSIDCMDDIRNAFRSVEIALKPEGSFIFEVPYLPAIYKSGLDSYVTHERKDYFTLESFRRPMKKFGLCIYKTERLGNSIRVYAKHGNEWTSLADEKFIVEELAA